MLFFGLILVGVIQNTTKIKWYFLRFCFLYYLESYYSIKLLMTKTTNSISMYYETCVVTFNIYLLCIKDLSAFHETIFEYLYQCSCNFSVTSFHYELISCTSYTDCTQINCVKNVFSCKLFSFLCHTHTHLYHIISNLMHPIFTFLEG
jgi:hypothetical protein